MDEEFIPKESTISLPIADITIKKNNEVVTTNYEYAVKRPKEYENDFMVEVKASYLRKARSILEPSTHKRKFPIHEVLLFFASTALGSSLGAIISGIEIDSILGILMYVICPIITVGTFVSYIFLRRNKILAIQDLADKVLEYIVDPDDTKD